MHIGKYIRDFLINAITFFGTSERYRNRVRKNGPLVRVLVFHDVQDAMWFSEIIVFLKTMYHLITPDDFVAKRFDEKKINVLLTFDDGYESWMSVCLPVLTTHNVRGLFFVNSGLLDVHDNAEKQARYVKKRLLLFPRKTLSWDGALELFR